MLRTVGLSTVRCNRKVSFYLDKVEKKYTLVGSEEADFAAGKISFKSPLGQAMMGKKKGEDFSFNAPAGTIKYTVVGIE